MGWGVGLGEESCDSELSDVAAGGGGCACAKGGYE
jgi:hypothetical protein